MTEKFELQINYIADGQSSTFISTQTTIKKCFIVVNDILCEKITSIYIKRIKK